MRASSTVYPYLPRLNLRAFSTETDRRFFLLIFAILSSSLYMFSSELVSLPLFPIGSEYASCINQSFPSNSTNQLAIGTVFYQCSALPARQEILGLLVLELLVLVIAGLLYYWFLPAWIFRQKQLDHLPKQEFAEVRAYLENLRQECEIDVNLQYVWNLNRSVVPLVFGRRGRYYFFLPYGFISLFSMGQVEVFRAIALHEMAHLRNKDVDKTYFAQAIWYSFIGVVLLSFFAFSLFALITDFTAVSGFIFNNIIRIFAMFVFIYIIRASVLRSREVYADIEAMQQDAPLEDMVRAMDRLRPGRLLRWLEVHPHPDERRAYIRDTQRLFSLKFWEATGVGIAFGIAYPALHDTFTMIGQLLSGGSLGMFLSPAYPDLGTLFLCLLVVLIIGPMIWHAVLVARLQGRELSGTGWIGLCLAAGMVLGLLLSVYFAPLAVSYKVSAQTLFVYFAPWVLFLALGLSGFCRWLALVASIWLEVVDSQTFFRIISALSFVVASLFLAVGLALFSQFLQLTLGYLLPGYVNLTILTHPILLKPIAEVNFYWRLLLQQFFVSSLQRYYLCFTFMSLWVLPLASWFWYRKQRQKNRLEWAIIGSPARLEAPDFMKPFHLRATVLIALVGSILMCGPLLYMRFQQIFYLHLASAGQAIVGAAGAAFLVGPFLLSVAFCPYLIVALAQACITTIIVLRAGRSGMISGLFGAFLGGCLMAAGTIVIYSLLGGIGEYQQYRFIFLYEVNWGAICALGMTMLMGMLRPQPHIQLKRHLFVVISCILLICVIIFLPDVVMSLSNEQPRTATNIVRDGDFEEPIVALDTSEQYTSEQSFGNWVVGSGDVELMGTRQFPAHGAQSIDLNGSAGAVMYQDLPTTSGASYTLSFAIAGNTECPEPAIKKMQVWWGSVPVAMLSFDITGYMPTYMGWQYHTYKVHATTDRTRLSFISVTPSACGPAVDDVTVEG